MNNRASVLFHNYDDNEMFRFESIPMNEECSVPFAVHKRRERKKLAKEDIPFGLKLFSVFCVASALFHKYDDNGMLRFESIQTNDKRGVPFVVRKRRERKKLTKDDIPFVLKLFFCLLCCSSLTYRCGYATLLAPRIQNKIASAIVTVFMNQSTHCLHTVGGMQRSSRLEYGIKCHQPLLAVL